jgi:VanZ family protein
VAGRWRGWLGPLALAGYSLSVVLFAAAVPALRRTWSLERFATLALAALGAAAALVALWSLRRRPWRKFLGLVAVAAAAWAVLRFGPNVEAGSERLLEQTHLAQFGPLAVLWTVVLARRLRDGSLYLTALVFVTAVALVDELVQWWIPGRVGALEDIRLDLLAGLVGAGFAALVLHAGVVPLRPGRAGWGVTLRALAPLALLLALFVDLVHVGHAFVLDEAAVEVRSRFDRAGLEARGRRFAPAPPGPWWRDLLLGEDFYLAEARFHHQRRNDLLAQGRRAAAWQEQLVLATLFAPYLDAQPEPARRPPPLGERPERSVLLGQGELTTGPPQLLTGLDRAVLWLLALSLASASALGGELLLGRRLGAGGPASARR